MPTISVEKTYGFSVDKVFSAAKRTEDLAKHLPSVTKLEILDQSPDTVRARWFGKVSVMGVNRDIKWTELDHWDDAGKTCRFEQTSGDFKLYKGEWKFTGEGAGTKSTLTVEYDLGLPIGGPLMDRMLANIVRNNAMEFLNGLEKLLS